MGPQLLANGQVTKRVFERENLIARLKTALGPSFVSRKYGEGIRQQIRYLERNGEIEGP